MSSVIEIEKVEIGEIIQFMYSINMNKVIAWENRYNTIKIEGQVIATYADGHRCIAWGNGNHNIIQQKHFDFATFKIWKSQHVYKLIDEYSDEYRYNIWIEPLKNITVNVISRDVILHPDQKCIGCKLPAPHAHPNDGNNFICSSC